jgi:hypothetical protein
MLLQFSENDPRANPRRVSAGNNLHRYGKNVQRTEKTMLFFLSSS